MTTRRAASRTATTSTAASHLSADSRRNSLETFSLEAGGRPFKRARLSDHSSSTSETRSAARQSETTTPIPDNSNQDANIPDIIPTLESVQVDDSDTVSLVDDDSLDDDRQDEDDSDIQRLLSPHPERRRGRRPKVKRPNTPTGSLADSLVPGTPINGELDDLDSDHDVQKAARRLPGRRRAPNADPYLEASLRRQLQLRMGHRAVSKALKPLLVELATRTTDQLDLRDREEQFWEIERHLALELQMCLESRLEVLESELRLAVEYYAQRLEKDEDYFKMQSMDRIVALHEDFIIRTEHRVLELGRQYEHEFDDNVTDDEDGSVILGLHGRPTACNHTGYLDARHDSRSRFFLEIKKLGDLRNERVQLSKQLNSDLKDYFQLTEERDEDALGIPLDFGAADEERQNKAASALNIHRLAYAASQIEKDELQRLQLTASTIPNRDALGLLALATATEYRQSPTNIRSHSLSTGQSLYQQTSPLVKVEHLHPEFPPHAYPAAPQNTPPSQENNFYPHTPKDAFSNHSEPHFRESPSLVPITHANISPTDTYPVYRHLRRASDSATESMNTPLMQMTRSRRGYSTSVATRNDPGSYQLHAGSDMKSSHRLLNINPHISQLPDSRADRLTLTSPGVDRTTGPFWHNVLVDSQRQNNAQCTEPVQAEDSSRRQSDLRTSRAAVNGTSSHVREHSTPIAHIIEDSPFRQVSPPHLSSPRTLQSPWRPPHTALPPPPPPPHVGLTSQPHSSNYYPLPSYPASYIVYSQAPSRGVATQETPPSTQQPGVFFGPPPPPQYGSPPGQQQHHPWYRQ